MNFLFDKVHRLAKTARRNIAAAAVTTAYMVTPRPASAQGLQTLVTYLHQTTGAAIDIVGVLMFVVGVMLVVQGLLKFKGDGRSQGEHGEAVKLIAIGAALIALPTFTGIGIGSIFGSGASTVNATSGSALSTVTAQ